MEATTLAVVGAPIAVVTAVAAWYVGCVAWRGVCYYLSDLDEFV